MTNEEPGLDVVYSDEDRLDLRQLLRRPQPRPASRLRDRPQPSRQVDPHRLALSR